MIININNEIISFPFIDSPGAATIIALTFNKGTLTLDASASVADDIITHSHCDQFSPHTKLWRGGHLGRTRRVRAVPEGRQANDNERVRVAN